MRRRNYYRFTNGQMETTTFNRRSKAHAGGWSTDKTTAGRRACVVYPLIMDALTPNPVIKEEQALKKEWIAQSIATYMAGYNRDQLRVLAAEEKIVGRGDMNKAQLADALARAGE